MCKAFGHKKHIDITRTVTDFYLKYDIMLLRHRCALFRNAHFRKNLTFKGNDYEKISVFSCRLHGCMMVSSLSTVRTMSANQ